MHQNHHVIMTHFVGEDYEYLTSWCSLICTQVAQYIDCMVTNTISTLQKHKPARTCQLSNDRLVKNHLGKVGGL